MSYIRLMVSYVTHDILWHLLKLVALVSFSVCHPLFPEHLHFLNRSLFLCLGDRGGGGGGHLVERVGLDDAEVNIFNICSSHWIILPSCNDIRWLGIQMNYYW